MESAVLSAIENVRKEGLTDVFPRPFEVEMLNGRAFREKGANLPDLLEYLAVAIIRLNDALIGRTAPDTLTGTHDPSVLARLKPMWPTADPWERRQIARILVGALMKDGAREWFMDVGRTDGGGADVNSGQERQSRDVFMVAMV